MSDQFYQPAPGDLVACDDGLHFILPDKANAHCNWVMRKHPDGGLVSVRKATEHELGHAKARQHLRAGVARLEESEGQVPEQEATEAGEPALVAYHCVDQYGQKKVLLPGAEGIRRHILHGSVLKQLTYMDTACRLLAERDALQQRLAESETALQDIQRICSAMGYLSEIHKVATKALANPGSADGEEAE